MQKETDIEKALLRKYPEQVVLVTTRNKEGKNNVMAVGWTAIVSSDPVMFVLGIDEEACTYQNILGTKQFVVSFPSEKMAKETLFVGSVHGYKRDKIQESGLEIQEAKIVNAPVLVDAVANFECKLVEITKPGDCPLVVGQVVYAWENTDEHLKRLYTVGTDHKLAGVRPIEP
ncbi:MAG TPA: flavin reductase family protein [bacterium]|nr:flavin reductase family protein [bacterium]HOL50049.1 flavin reductase family protein [bacterium]HPO51466.1 flavin reductase family protein [bacterium]HXK45231.1 flavin reductase family protein [bacterium]